jgi:hypothetical protein
MYHANKIGSFGDGNVATVLSFLDPNAAEPILRQCHIVRKPDNPSDTAYPNDEDCFVKYFNDMLEKLAVDNILPVIDAFVRACNLTAKKFERLGPSQALAGREQHRQKKAPSPQKHDAELRPLDVRAR